MKIHIHCGSGSPDGIVPTDIDGNSERVGIGGAELALFTLCKGWVDQGHEIVIYNNPRKNDRIFDQRNSNTFDKGDKRDILIVWREPTQRVLGSTGKKIFFSTDPYTSGDFKHFAQFVDKVVTISPYHSSYFEATYDIRNSIPIDLPVRTWEYENKIEKVPNRLIFTSVPDRGLEFVSRTLPQLKEAIPDISLVITSDYRLWGAVSPLNSQYVQSFMREENVEFLGAVSRARLVEEQLKAQILYYPCNFLENFCIAAAEAQVAGVLPITTDIGALLTTNMGVLIHGDARHPLTQQVFVDKTVEYLKSDKLAEIQADLRERALARFSLDAILKQWSELIFADN